MTRGGRFLLVLVTLALPVTVGIEIAEAQDLAVADSVFVAKPAEPIVYTTTYDRSVSSGTWSNYLSYYHTTNRATFGIDANINTLEAIRGLQANGSDGSFTGRINLRATNHWIWSVDGTFMMFSNSDDLSSTDRRQNRLQARTQYNLNPLPQLSAVGILFSEFQEEQSLGARSIPGSPKLVIDNSVVPPDTTTYRAHTTRDSSYTSGRRDGVSGSLRWTPTPSLEIKGSGTGTYLGSKTRTLTRDFYAINPGEGATLRLDSLGVSKAPNGDRRFDAGIAFKGIPRGAMTLSLNNADGDQEYYLLTKRDQEHLSYGSRGGAFHIEHAPFPGAQVSLDGAMSRSLREYVLQKNLNSLVNSRTLMGTFMINKPESRASLGFQLGRTRNDRQVTQNGRVINRAMNLAAATRVTRRLWLDTNGSVTLYSRIYDDKISDRDDVRGYVNAGGGYAVSPRCSTSVHFSTNRSHTVAIDPGSSGGNNVQTTYQMDALLNLRVSKSLTIVQNYQINANYLIYDYDEPRNTLTRIRRIDTTLSDSLFSFGFLKLTHNFFFQDRGAYSRATGEDIRTYSVAQQLYQQNVGVTLGVRPVPGITLSATQSLANTRNYFLTGGQDTNRNRWNLNLSGVVDRDLPGDMTLHGSVQHIGEYTEKPSYLPSAEVVDYWLAGATFTKSF